MSLERNLERDLVRPHAYRGCATFPGTFWGRTWAIVAEAGTIVFLLRYHHRHHRHLAANGSCGVRG